MASPRILIVKTGAASPEVSREHGDFEDWFREALGDHARFSVAFAYGRGPDEVPRLPRLADYDGVIVTGSPASVTAPTPWMESAGAQLREHAEAGGALLGVCFGHQLMCHAFGAPVILNPAGREIGTVRVRLTEAGRADPLFEGLPEELVVNCTHVDRASRLPAGTTLLAGNDNTAVQAVRLGARARGVQFHPEITAPGMRALIRSRAEPMRAEGMDADACAQRVEGCPTGFAILRHFESRLCGGRQV